MNRIGLKANKHKSLTFLEFGLLLLLFALSNSATIVKQRYYKAIKWQLWSDALTVEHNDTSETLIRSIYRIEGARKG